jgi:DNA-binding response OmpR family regulator
MQTPPKPNVLFLEDDADTRELVKFSLEQAGINVISAETVADAWQAALSRDVDLYLLDGLIPHGDSLKLCRDLRTIEPDKPIVFYSGLAYKADIQKGLDAGATGYLVKPYSGDLAEEILRYISKATHFKSTAPLFINKGNVLEEFENQDEATTGDSVRIMEFGGALDRDSTQAGIAARQRQFRTTRTSSGII